MWSQFWMSANEFVPSLRLSLFQNRKTLGTRFYFVNQRLNSFCSNVPMFQDDEQSLARGRGDTQRHLLKNKMKSPHAIFTLRLFPIHYFWNIGTKRLYIYIFIKNYYYYSNKIKHLRLTRPPKSWRIIPIFILEHLEQMEQIISPTRQSKQRINWYGDSE